MLNTHKMECNGQADSLMPTVAAETQSEMVIIPYVG